MKRKGISNIGIWPYILFMNINNYQFELYSYEYYDMYKTNESKFLYNNSSK